MRWAPRLNPGAYAYVIAPDELVDGDPIVVVRAIVDADRALNGFLVRLPCV